MARQWHYWTKNKLQILGDYVPAFNRASKSRPTRLYLDVMAGQPENVERYTGEAIHGSPKRVLSAEPGFTHHVFFELPRNATKLEQALEREFPHQQWQVVPGDCNVMIAETLAELRSRRLDSVPTFAFIDQQAAEVRWDTLVKIAHFKGRNPYTKPELWLLVSPTMVAKGVRGSGAEAFRDRVTRFYGTRNWLNIQDARESSLLTAPGYRDEMTNLIRYRLVHDLRYRFTQRIPMRMANGTTIYDMVFATDHYVGDKIMRHLYRKAAEREPAMMAEAQRLAKMEQERRSGYEGLFPLPLSTRPTVDAGVLWQPTSCWRPSDREWWSERD
ncbi:three-Cys-motif partner protein TcmP [Nocardia terpenica]|uniref:three-Cys-motif partner protein TcmP n=1 Tax=Nocardia terpenica TaxID=455432 RepID=UPI001894CBF7|nr:three-Cys-motif partner protein TcmP [Nocardia terpenica]MBF6065439.1 three-Cys-motif partner protein TcmP [Nocardia terpenica]MBF6109121.1 three-Cys-motif partner protein TcmP [Nocardia terpenica]MBF6114677.1 three-Cys-motif partner protein TcmP [Nocardia terpenica]MBF6123362.1 three-Cys-motif partner protein TcmP [Nocardia terpenica]MBF6156620.1 three-Cys-motif partner protein TcmP [Nocardia terpenica]